MASLEQLADLREAIQELDADGGWTDVRLMAIIDETGSVEAAAQRIWVRKAASVAHLVDISEGGSSRKMSDLHKNFLDIANGYGSGAGSNGMSSPISRKAERA